MNKEEAAQSFFGIGRMDTTRELTSLASAQEKAILDTLNLTDAVDSVYEQQADGRSFAASFKAAREKYEDIRELLPDGDLRSNLLRTTLKAYQDAGTLILGSELQHYKGSTIETMAVARMRKVFLRKIMSNDLDQEAQHFVNYLLGKAA
jgi:hypothetical protein